MKVKLFAAGALATALLVAGVPLGAGSATAGSTTKIMLAGDSITQGRNGDYTWRYRFAMEVKRQAVSGIDLVGPSKFPNSYGSPSVHHYLASGWDTDHDAVSGTFLASQVTKIGAQVAKYQPDILVSFLGTNDLMDIPRKHPNATRAQLLPLYRKRITQMVATWKTYIANVRAAKPDIKIVLGEVVAPEVPFEILEEYNADLADLAQKGSILNESVVVVAQLAGTIWSSTRYLYDGLHPTPTAETLLAQKFAEAINEADPGLFPGPIKIQQGYVPWNPPLQARVETVGHRIKLNWAFTETYNSTTKMRVKIITKRNGNERVGAFQASTRWRSPVLAPGTYRIKLQASRAAMNSGWSPAFVVKIPKTAAPAQKH